MAKRNIVHIKNLEPEADAPAICDVFRNYGKIVCVNIAVDDNLVPLGVGYIQFEKRESAYLAAKELHGKYNDIGKPLFVSLTENIEDNDFTNLYVKNFSLKWDDFDLIQHFEKFGLVQHAVVEVNANGKSRGYGYVNFDHHEEAKAAVKALHDKLIDGKKLYVQPLVRKEKRELLKSISLEYAKENLEKSTQYNNLYVCNLPKDLTDEQLKNLFKKFGDIESMKIERNEKLQSRGYGFVAFKDKESAKLALEEMNGYELGSNLLKVNFKQNKSQREHYNKLKKATEALLNQGATKK